MPPLTTRLPARRRHDDRGLASVEWAILAPLLLFVIFAAIQAGAWSHARNVALSAASACAEHSRGLSASTSQGQASASSIATQSGAFDSVGVSISRGGTQVRCTVSGRAVTVINVAGFGQISQTAALPTERITRP